MLMPVTRPVIHQMIKQTASVFVGNLKNPANNPSSPTHLIIERKMDFECNGLPVNQCDDTNLHNSFDVNFEYQTINSIQPNVRALLASWKPSNSQLYMLGHGEQLERRGDPLLPPQRFSRMRRSGPIAFSLR